MSNSTSSMPAYMHILDEMQRMDANGEWNTVDSWGTYASIEHVIEVLSEWKMDGQEDGEINTILRGKKMVELAHQ